MLFLLVCIFIKVIHRHSQIVSQALLWKIAVLYPSPPHLPLWEQSFSMKEAKLLFLNFNLFLWFSKIYWQAMVPHSSTLAWKIPWTEDPGRLQSMGSLRVGHDWATSLSLFTFMHGRSKWQPTLVFLPGESQGQGSLVGCRLWGRTESDTTEAT